MKPKNNPTGPHRKVRPRSFIGNAKLYFIVPTVAYVIRNNKLQFMNRSDHIAIPFIVCYNPFIIKRVGL